MSEEQPPAMPPRCRCGHYGTDHMEAGDGCSACLCGGFRPGGFRPKNGEGR